MAKGYIRLRMMSVTGISVEIKDKPAEMVLSDTLKNQRTEYIQ
jgi:hypothetical protein